MSAQSNHPVFEAPPDPNIKIWRYMDFTKFMSLLDTDSLFFSRADLLGDPYEGATSHFNNSVWPIVYKNKIPPKARLRNSFFKEWQRQWTFVNCWHMNEVESAAMWKLYAKTNEAVAIQSTYSLLHSALSSNVYVGTVKYIDYETEWLPEGNNFYPYVHKRRSFAHERELRAVIWNPPHKIEPDGKSGMFENRQNPDAGRMIPIDVGSVVQNVFVAPTCPDWFRDLVANVVARYGLATPVAPSAIDKPPTF